jgi:hypothetical protein
MALKKLALYAAIIIATVIAAESLARGTGLMALSLPRRELQIAGLLGFVVAAGRLRGFG